MMDSVSEKLLLEVHPGLGAKIRAMEVRLMHLAQMEDIRIIQGCRTWPEQDLLFAKVPRVTKARGGYSMHNFGLAVDCCPYKVAGQPWAPDWNAADLHYTQMVAAGVAEGLNCGANWHSFKDEPHFQLAGIPTTPTDVMRADFAKMTKAEFWALVDSGKYNV